MPKSDIADRDLYTEINTQATDFKSSGILSAKFFVKLELIAEDLEQKGISQDKIKALLDFMGAEFNQNRMYFSD